MAPASLRLAGEDHPRFASCGARRCQDSRGVPIRHAEQARCGAVVHAVPELISALAVCPHGTRVVPVVRDHHIETILAQLARERHLG